MGELSQYYSGMNQLELCEKIAREAHAGQFRRDGVTPYIEHVEAVVSRCETEEEKCVAWLHDVLEDTKARMYDLIEWGVEDEILSSVHVLTLEKGASYDRFIERIRRHRQVTRNVKIADILSNLSDSPTPKQIVKYAKALLVLVSNSN